MAQPNFPTVIVSLYRGYLWGGHQWSLGTLLLPLSAVVGRAGSAAHSSSLYGDTNPLFGRLGATFQKAGKTATPPTRSLTTGLFQLRDLSFLSTG